MSELKPTKTTLGEIYDAMPEADRKKAFFLLFGICEFYQDGDTWFAVSLLPDSPAGAIIEDFRYCPELHRKAPGGRARLAFSWILSAFKRVRSKMP